MVSGVAEGGRGGVEEDVGGEKGREGVKGEGFERKEGEEIGREAGRRENGIG